MIQAKTYTVGDLATVRRLDDLAGAWTDVSLTNTFPLADGVLTDVETDPLDGNKVFVTGEGVPTNGLFGVYVSINGGTAWLIPGGDYQTNIDPGFNRLKWWEVWVFDSNTIMISGNNGYVAISIDGGNTFTLTTQLPALPPTPGGSPAIPTCYSLHFPTATTGVVGTDAHVALTIDGGSTWSIMNGGNILSDGVTDADQVLGIHMDSTQQIIVACARNAVFRSIDGGLSWTVVYMWASSNGRHLTWINDSELWAFGHGGERIKSTDGGATWSIIQAWAPAGPLQFSGHFYQGQNGFWGQGNNVLATNNGSATGVISEVAPRTPQAIWTWFIDETCYLLEACDGITPPILVDNDLSASVGQVIRVCPEDLPPVGGGGIGNGTPLVPVPNDPCDTAFDLIDCCGLLPTIQVTNDLGAYQNLIVVIPSINLTTCWRVDKATNPQAVPLGCVNLGGAVVYATCNDCHEVYPCQVSPSLEECTCFTILEADGCTDAITLLNIGPIYPTCEACADKCYLLIDCLDVNNYIISSDQNLAQYVGQVVHLKDCPDKCWRVLDAPDCDQSVCTSEVIASFPDCQSCLPPVPEIPPVELHPRRVKPGYYTPGCSPEYTEKVNCNFGEQMYNQMLIDRYGLTICCEPDRIRWSIKKELLDLKAIYDPELCRCTLNQCCPPVCVDATIQVFSPRLCPPPADAIALISLVPAPCPPPTDINYVWINQD